MALTGSTLCYALQQNLSTLLETGSTIERTQFAFDLSGVKCKTRAEILRNQRAWNVYEMVENYDTQVYQKIQQGNRGTLFYQYKGSQEATDYKIGQQLHEMRYPYLQFTPVRNCPFPDIPSNTGIPNISGNPRSCSAFKPTQTSSDYLLKQTDMNTYIYVSTYNSQHVYKYLFVSDDEKMAYNRAIRALALQQ
jgi:hypothetical protein